MWLWFGAWVWLFRWAAGWCSAGTARTDRPRARHRLGSFFAAAQFVGFVHRRVEFLVRLDQRGRHGQRVVQVGQRRIGELGSSVKHGLRGGFDGRLRLFGRGRSRGGWQVGPREVVIDDVFGITVIAFQSAPCGVNPCVVHVAAKNAKVVQASAIHVKRRVADNTIFDETQREKLPSLRACFRNEDVLSRNAGLTKKPRSGRELLGRLTVLTKLTNLCQKCHHAWHRSQFRGGCIRKPKAEIGFSVNKIVSSQPRSKPLLCSRLLFNKTQVLVLREGEDAVIQWSDTFNQRRHSKNRL